MSLQVATRSWRKPYAGVQMEGPIASWYARSTRIRPDRPETARAIAEQVAEGGAILEVAPGPGYLAIELARLGKNYRISGLDISHSFVRIAHAKAREAGVSIDFRQGDVAHMPFAGESFDFIVCQAAFKNFPDPVGALNEMHRVLSPGGRAVILDLRKDAPLAAIEAEVRSMNLNPLNAFVTRLIFRYGLLRAALSRDALERVAAASRFAHSEIILDGIGVEVRLVK